MNRSNISLTRAVTDGDAATVQALVAAGSDVNTTASGGQTPLILAILFRRTQILSLLLEAGADPLLPDSLGLNALDWAQRKGFAEGLKLLTQRQTAKQQTPPITPSTERTPPGESLSSQMEKQGTRLSTGSSQPVSSDEKSRRWLAGFKRRIEEEASHRVKEVQPAPTPPTTKIEATPKNELPPVVVNESPVHASPTVPPLISSPEPVANVQTDTSQLKDQPYTAPAISLVVPPADVARSEPPRPTIRTPPVSNSRKRCPKCNAVYDSELLAYCAVDMTPLVAADEPVAASPPKTASMPLIWLLVVFTGIVVAGVTYLMMPNLMIERNAPSATSPTPALSVKELPLVAGGLSGKQLDVPAPEYPASARSDNVSGTVTIRVTVDKKGRVIAVKVVEGDWRLRQAAIAAAKKATFSPEKLMGRGAVGTIAYTFKE
jgi:TonB family protein